MESCLLQFTPEEITIICKVLSITRQYFSLGVISLIKIDRQLHMESKSPERFAPVGPSDHSIFVAMSHVLLHCTLMDGKLYNAVQIQANLQANGCPITVDEVKMCLWAGDVRVAVRKRHHCRCVQEGLDGHS